MANPSIERQDALMKLTFRLRDAGHLSEDEVSMLVMAAEGEWDDALHIAAPWGGRQSLCGGWGRNLVALDQPRPDGWEGCWSCLQAADWLDHVHPNADRLKEMQANQRPMQYALKAAAQFLYSLPKTMKKSRRREALLRQVQYAIHGEEER